MKHYLKKCGVSNAITCWSWWITFSHRGEAGPTDTVYLGVFLKSAINAIGGFDPAFIRAQDWELNFRLRKNGGVVFFQPDLRVTYRPRSSVRALAKQYFEYGRWRREVMRTHPGTINLRYLAPPVTLAISTVGFCGHAFLIHLFNRTNWIFSGSGS